MEHWYYSGFDTRKTCSSKTCWHAGKWRGLLHISPGACYGGLATTLSILLFETSKTCSLGTSRSRGASYIFVLGHAMEHASEDGVCADGVVW